MVDAAAGADLGARETHEVEIKIGTRTHTVRVTLDEEQLRNLTLNGKIEALAVPPPFVIRKLQNLQLFDLLQRSPYSRFFGKSSALIFDSIK